MNYKTFLNSSKNKTELKERFDVLKEFNKEKGFNPFSSKAVFNIDNVYKQTKYSLRTYYGLTSLYKDKQTVLSFR